jgi:hypothetical protein
MRRRTWIGERCNRVAAGKLQDILDVVVDPRWPAVCEDVRADLADGGLEEDELAVVDFAADRVAQELDGLVENVQSFVKPAEVGTELKWLLGSASLRSQLGLPRPSRSKGILDRVW